MKRRGFLSLVATLPFWPFCKQGQAETDVPCDCDTRVVPIKGYFETSESWLDKVVVGPWHNGRVLFRIEYWRKDFVGDKTGPRYHDRTEWETVPFDTREVSVATKPNGWYFGPACLCNQDRPFLVCTGTVLKGPGTTPGAMAILLSGIADQNAKLRETLA